MHFIIGACLALALALVAPGVQPAVASDWNIVHHDGRDYLPLNDVARFYGFPHPVPAVSEIAPVSITEPNTKKLRLENDAKQLEVTLNGRSVVINGVQQWLAFPVVAVDDQLIISRVDLAKRIEPAMRPEMIPHLAPIKTVVLDPGHGGHDKGAVSIFGAEKDFSLDVCLRAKKLLEAKRFKVVLTRSTDVFVPLHERPAVANRIPDCIFVSVHFNQAGWNPAANGFEIFSLTPRGAPSMEDGSITVRDLRSEPGNVVDVPSVALAASIYHSMLGNIPNTDRGMKHQRFAVIRLAKVPSVLIEGGFVSNSNEVRQIATPAWRQKLAESIVTGIEGYKALAEHKVPPKLVADYRRTSPTNVTMSEAPAVVTNTQSSMPAEGGSEPKTQ